MTGRSIKFLTGSIVVLIFFTVIVFLVSKTTTPASYLESLETQEVVINDETFVMFIADNPVTQARGLSFIAELPEMTGMLFVFSEKYIPKFWMKDMRFGLDMIWLDEVGTVVDIHQNIMPDTYPETFSPIEPAQAVIEVTAGTVDTLGIGVGDTITIN